MEEVCDRTAEMVADILAVLPGMGFEDVMNMYWEELSFWHRKAVNVSKKMNGGR